MNVFLVHYFQPIAIFCSKGYFFYIFIVKYVTIAFHFTGKAQLFFEDVPTFTY